MKVLFVVIFLTSIACGVGYAAYETWIGLNEVEISIHGKTALALGVILTFALGTGLMFLIFYSNRKGYDVVANKQVDRFNSTKH